MSDICTVKKSTLDGIAEAIQSKTGESGGMLPSEMKGKIEDLPSQPAKGLVFSEYDSDGYPHKAEFVGSWTEIPNNFYVADGTLAITFCKYITTVKLPNGLTKIGSHALNNKYLTNITIPQGVTSILNNAFASALVTELIVPSSYTAITVDSFGGLRYCEMITFEGDITAVARYGFEAAGTKTTTLTIDFSHCTGVPTLENTNAFYGTVARVFKVPSALLSEWQNATNWVGLTNVTWQGV